jgi:hypothetical protein
MYYNPEILRSYLKFDWSVISNHNDVNVLVLGMGTTSKKCQVRNEALEWITRLEMHCLATPHSPLHRQ